MMGVEIMALGFVVLFLALVACPVKPASVFISIYMISTGLAFYFLGEDLEKLRKT